jgi:hypothetical protein
MKKSESIANLAKALSAAQGEIKNPTKDSSADTGKYRYGYLSLPALREAITPILAKHGLSVVQSAGSGERGPVVTTLLMHLSGEWIESDPLAIPVGKSDAQGCGSAISYARRYALEAMFSLAAEDDDGSAASQPAPRQAVAATKVAPSPELTRLKEFDAAMTAEGFSAPLDRLRAAGRIAEHLGFDRKKSTTWSPQLWQEIEEQNVKFERTSLQNLVASLLDAKGETPDRMLAWLKAKPGTSLAMLDVADLREVVARLRPLPDVAAAKA